MMTMPSDKREDAEKTETKMTIIIENEGVEPRSEMTPEMVYHQKEMTSPLGEGNRVIQGTINQITYHFSIAYHFPQATYPPCHHP